jgi:hypothetical protein
MATTKPLTDQENYHPSHYGHPKQESCAENNHEDDHPPGPLPQISDECLARKVLSTNGYNGSNGKSNLDQSLTGGHGHAAGGHSGQLPEDQRLPELDHDASPIEASRLEPTYWRDLYKERCARRQLGYGYPRAEAELLAWRELECRWHMRHGERVSSEICAGCRRPIGTAEAILVIDGARIHANGDDCLIRHGERWRSAATRGLMMFGLQPPMGAP